MYSQFTLHEFRIDARMTKFEQKTNGVFDGPDSHAWESQGPARVWLTKPRLASFQQKKWRRHKDTVCWVSLQVAQRKGLKFYQTKCNAIIFYGALSIYCRSKEVVMEFRQIMCQNVHVSLWPPLTKSQGHLDVRFGFWFCRKQQRHPKNRTKSEKIQLSSSGRRVWRKKEIEEHTKVDCDTLNWEKHDP